MRQPISTRFNRFNLFQPVSTISTYLNQFLSVNPFQPVSRPIPTRLNLFQPVSTRFYLFQPSIRLHPFQPVLDRFTPFLPDPLAFNRFNALLYVSISFNLFSTDPPDPLAFYPFEPI